MDRFLSTGRAEAFLRGVGIFIKDYASDTCIPNTLWRELGHPLKTMRGDRWLGLLHPDDSERVRTAMGALKMGCMDSWEGVFRLRAKDGSYKTIRHKALVLERDKDKLPTLYVGYDVDITEYDTLLKVARQEGEYNKKSFLRSEEIRSAGVILSSELEPSDAAARMLHQAQRVVPSDASMVRALEGAEIIILASLGMDEQDENSDAMPTILRQESETHRIPIIHHPKDGIFRTVMTVPLLRRDLTVGDIVFLSRQKDAYGSDEQAAAMLFSEQAGIAFSNALRYKATEQEAVTDWLTGLPTRRAFMARASRISAEFPRDTPLAALMIDIDHFKKVNDSLGHPAGDSALVAVAEACRDALRGEDLFCRYGGEEIVVLLPGADERVALTAGERVRQRIAAIRMEEHPELRLTVSVGICAATIGADFRELIARADEALYMAKESGRNRCQIR